MLLAMSCIQWKAATTDCSVGEDIFWGVAQKVMIYVAVFMPHVHQRKLIPSIAGLKGQIPPKKIYIYTNVHIYLSCSPPLFTNIISVIVCLLLSRMKPDGTYLESLKAPKNKIKNYAAMSLSAHQDLVIQKIQKHCS